jgi:hypothetical protein
MERVMPNNVPAIYAMVGFGCLFLIMATVLERM